MVLRVWITAMTPCSLAIHGASGPMRGASTTSRNMATTRSASSGLEAGIVMTLCPVASGNCAAISLMRASAAGWNFDQSIGAPMMKPHHLPQEPFR